MAPIQFPEVAVQTAEVIPDGECASAADFQAYSAPLSGYPALLVPEVKLNGKPIYVCKTTVVTQREYFKEINAVEDRLTTAAALAFAIRHPDGSRLFKPENAIQLANFDGEKGASVLNFFLAENGLISKK